jgi:aspartate/methionine/tyrosine aminotransferase
VTEAAWPAGAGEPFHLERFFARHEFTTPHLLAVSDCETTTVGALLELEPDALERFGRLRLGYTESAGNPALRRAIVGHHPGLEPDDVLVHAAGVEVLLTACRALLSPGDRAVVQTPCYQALRTAPALAGAEVVPWPARWRPGTGASPRGEPGAGGGRWEWDEDRLDDLLARPRVRLLVLNTPHNPTGRRFDEATVRRLLGRARDRGVRVLVDEAYAGAEVDADPVPSAAELDPEVAALGLVSKAMGLPGLRIGWLACRDRGVLAAAEAVKDHTTICAPAPAEFLAALALRHRHVLLARTRAVLRENRARLATFMSDHREWFREAPPEAGSVCLPRMAADAPLSADALCARARREAGILLAPGRLFGEGPPDTVAPPVADAIRLGFGRAGFASGLEALAAWLADGAR